MGGLSFREAHFMAETLAATGQLCSMDLMEVNPGIGENPNLVYVRRHRRHYKAIARSLATVLRCGTSTAAVGCFGSGMPQGNTGLSRVWVCRRRRLRTR